MSINPYEPPQSLGAAESAEPPSILGRRLPPFVSARLRARIVIGLLAADVICSALVLLALLSQAELVANAMAGQGITPAEAAANDFRVVLLSRASVAIYIACAIMFIAWLYRAHKNLPAFGVERLDFTPGWVIGSWFIPILSLFKPYQVVRETWLASNPKYIGDSPWRWRNGAGTPLLPAWWAGFLAMNIFGWVSAVGFDGGTQLENLRDGSYAAALQNAIEIVAALLAVAVVLSIDKRQQLANETVHRLSAATEPGGPATA